jgi:1-acyl-sn-glycerol-3-phosphate acyltransferase
LYQLYACHVVFQLATIWFYKFKFIGRENIEKNKSYIVSPNHISYLDVFLVAIAVGKPLSYMAKKELFESSNYIARNMDRLGAFSVNREKPEIATIRSVNEVFKTNWSLGIFPQGGIKKNKTLEDINHGFVMFAKMAKRDILPVSITGFEGYNWKFLKRQEVIVKIGKPISYQKSDDEILKLWCEEIAGFTGYAVNEKCLVKS